MKFGLFAVNIGPLADPEAASVVGPIAEELGFDSLWAIEHAVVPAGYESRYPYSADGKMPAGEVMAITDPLVWLSFAAATTRHVRLCTGILILPQRNPVVLAKEVATLDRLSGGRVTLGVGVGWLEEEFRALGVPFAERGARTDDYVDALRALWTQTEATHHGSFTSFERAIISPQPVQQPVPILVGGHTPPACRRAGERGDAFYPGCSSFEETAAAIGQMRAAAVGAGRDPDQIEITTGAPFSAAAWSVDEIHRLEDLGVSRVTLLPPAFDEAGLRQHLGDYAETIIANV